MGSKQCRLKSVGFATSVDPDLTPQNAASDQDPHCSLLIGIFSILNILKLKKILDLSIIDVIHTTKSNSSLHSSNLTSIMEVIVKIFEKICWKNQRIRYIFAYFSKFRRSNCLNKFYFYLIRCIYKTQVLNNRWLIIFLVIQHFNLTYAKFYFSQITCNLALVHE